MIKDVLSLKIVEEFFLEYKECVMIFFFFTV